MAAASSRSFLPTSSSFLTSVSVMFFSASAVRLPNSSVSRCAIAMRSSIVTFAVRQSFFSLVMIDQASSRFST